MGGCAHSLARHADTAITVNPSLYRIFDVHVFGNTTTDELKKFLKGNTIFLSFNVTKYTVRRIGA